MIDRIIVENFKNFRRLDVSLGRANLLIGENGSGKSNFLELFRVLRGLSWGLTVTEVLDGKPPDDNFSGWDGIRGASAAACFAHDDSEREVMIDVRGTTEPPQSESWEYLVKFSPEAGSLVRERLKLGSKVRYDSAPDSPEAQLVSRTHPLDDDLVIRGVGVGPILAQVRRDLAGVGSVNMLQSTPTERNRFTDIGEGVSRIAGQAKGVANSLARIFPFDPSPVVLRQYSQSGTAGGIGDRGENFAALVESLCLDSEYKESLLWWIRELLSERVEDVGIIRGSEQKSIFKLCDQSKDVPATILSDGTLRFAALLATLFQPEKPSMITLDAVESAVHPNRLRLLYLLLWDESEYHGIQSISTTHSPVMLEWMHESDLATTFVCKMDHSTGESKVISLTDVPHFMDSFKRGSRTSDMLVESWFEVAS